MKLPFERAKRTCDKTVVLLMILLICLGLVTLFSATYYQRTASGDPLSAVKKQLFGIGLGAAACVFLSNVPYRFFRRAKVMLTLLGISALLLILVIIPGIGVSINGSRRWLNLLGLSMQPSEFAKIGVILTFAHMICRFRGAMGSFQWGILPFAGILLVIGALLVMQPHMSATIIIFAMGAVMMFMGGAQLIWFIAGGSLLVIAFTAITLLFPYVSTRITTWLDPWSNLRGDGYQIVQSIYAISSGGLFGLGLGNSRQKYLYLPEEHNDFIFAVVCEELGFVGATLILLLFALLICRGYWIAFHCRDRYSFLVAAGISTLLAMQVILNVAVVTNTIPCTGISLPFFSYGGTALWIELGEMGIVLSISRGVWAGTPAPKKRTQERNKI